MTGGRSLRVAGKPYEWPSVTVVHPEFGSYRLDIHGVRRKGSGIVTLVVFSGALSTEQVPIVRSTAEGTGSEIVQLSEDDISQDLAVFLAAQVHAKPKNKVFIAPGGEWGIGGSSARVSGS